MSFGVVLLAHEALDRVGEVASYWSRHGHPVAIHIDRSVSRAAFEGLRGKLSVLNDVHFAKRRNCNWGTWSIVEATEDSAGLLLDRHPDIGHVLLMSGSCLPIRPAEELGRFLAKRPGVDFIESVRASECSWAKGGLDRERFTLHFPFPWKKARRAFDISVAVQRRAGVRRRPPDGIDVHIGSQWWCLSAVTLRAILDSPERARARRYFRSVWIPDESYFQTMARKVSQRIESRSLTLSRFDAHGAPHVFYDDHADALAGSGYFISRKIWRGSNGLYRRFLSEHLVDSSAAVTTVDQMVEAARLRRTRGRPGLVMQARLPNDGWENGRTAGPYGILAGLDTLLPGLAPWAAAHGAPTLHGRLFARGRAEFAGDGDVGPGALSAAAELRDYNPAAFLMNLVRATDGPRQVFSFGPSDSRQVLPFIARDANAHIVWVTGAWILPLAASRASREALLRTTARLQNAELECIDTLTSPLARAKVEIFDLSEFAAAPAKVLAAAHRTLTGGAAPPLAVAPDIADLEPIWPFLRAMRDAGLNLQVFGRIPDEDEDEIRTVADRTT